MDTPISIAPMIQWTDTNYRNLFRLIAKEPLLYTEMITASSVVNAYTHDKPLHGWIASTPAEAPLAVQIGGGGGSELATSELATAAELILSHMPQPPTELNINCGCPSNKAKRANFGLNLMRSTERDRLRHSLSAVVKRVGNRIETISVKCRLGIVDGVDDNDDCDDSSVGCADLKSFISVVSSVGIRKIIIHARVGVAKGLSTGKNRTVPPLMYEVVEQMVTQFPEITIILNGGISSLQQAQSILSGVYNFDNDDNNKPWFDHATSQSGYGWGPSIDWGVFTSQSSTQSAQPPHGVMIGRLAYNNPTAFHNADSLFFNKLDKDPTFREIVEDYIDITRAREFEFCSHGISQLAKPLHNLFKDVVKDREYKQTLDQLLIDHGKNKHHNKDVGSFSKADVLNEIVSHAMATIDDEILDSHISISTKI
ncbi:hypothetical protein ScalyP_jg10371 [Parmales sp. scaly parma]|nr:hypothetical protein ScalyP_jg10371 [Parmales sp. scaly parma]